MNQENPQMPEGAQDFRVKPESAFSSETYFFSPELATFKDLGIARMQLGLGAVQLLSGISGGGKTSYARAIAAQLGTTLEGKRHQCDPGNEQEIHWRPDIEGIIGRTNAYMPGPAWRAFIESNHHPTVLLIDEIDKAHPDFDPFLLQLLDEMQFQTPDYQTLKANPANLFVIITSNGRRELYPEVLRRAQRIDVPFPDRERLKNIVEGIVPMEVPPRLLDLVFRLGDSIRRQDPNNGPSPKEISLLLIDLMILKQRGNLDKNQVRQVGMSYLVKFGGNESISKAISYDWAQALITEVNRQ
jgi:MoxR-like ATPase